MRAKNDSMPLAVQTPTVSGQLISIFVEDSHPLLALHRALDWEAIQAVMVKHWRAAGKNVDSGPGQPWPVPLYVPLVVLALVKGYHSRQMEDYLNESVVARRFCALSDRTQMHIRDHSNIARAVAAVGAQGLSEVNRLVINQAQEFGFTGPEILSSDTTVQEPLIGYPNEPGILKGLAERCQRALNKLKKRGVRRAQSGIAKAKEIYRSIREHRLFAKTKPQRKRLLGKIVHQTEQLLKLSEAAIEAAGKGVNRVKASAVAKLKAMSEVAGVLLPQIKQWMATGKVATDKIIHAGLSEARSIVTDKAGRRVKFGFKWLIHRLKGGYLFGRRVKPRASEYEMPIASLRDYQELFGEKQLPSLIVYDRGGRSGGTVEKLKEAGVKKIGIPPCGQGEWLVGKREQKRVKSERGKTEGSIGRLKSKKYGLSHRQERSEQTQEAVGQRAIVSANLNTMMRDLMVRAKAAQAA